MKDFKPILGILISMWLLFGYNSFAQVDNFDLSEYKLPEVKRQTLETEVILDGGHNYYNEPNQGELKNNRYKGNLNINYALFSNTPFNQKYINSSLYLSSYYSTYKRDDGKSSTFEMQPQLNYESGNRRYYKPDRFFETGLTVKYIFENEKIKSENSNQDEWIRKIQNHAFLGSVPLKIGWGRIEPVQDARQSLYILDELTKQNRISGFTKENVLRFAEVISHLKNKRHFDSRLRKIYEIGAIDSFLRADYSISQPDARYFTTIMDYWDYGSLPLRNSGKRFSFGIHPGVYLNKYLNEGDEFNPLNGNYNIKAILINGGFEYVREKPVNLYWQNTMELNGSVGIIYGIIKDNIINYSMSFS